MSDEAAALARYEQVALAIAQDITKGVYPEGEKISGRSILASKYNTSPETVRKALSLLQSKQAVEVVPNSGTVIGSRQAAEDFVSSLQEFHSLEAMESALRDLVKERNRLNDEIEQLIKHIVHFKSGMIRNMQHAEEVRVTASSSLIGRSIQEAKLRTITGVTVIAVQQDGKWYVSPGEELHLAADDILLVVGPPTGIELLNSLMVY